MVVNNFNLLEIYFEFLVNKEDFYYIQVIQRKKDGHKKSERIVKNFYIYNKEDFLNKQEYIIDLCKQHNARAYFWINPRNSRKIALECVKSYADLVSQGDCTKGYKVWDKKCGANPAPGYDRLWIVDVDNKELLLKIKQLIQKCRSAKTGDSIIDTIPTSQGYHVITIGFDLHHFKQLLKIEQLEDVDVHKDNPTLLYYEKT